jgi:glycosyltransferase involved in cell wall biosynthesis
MRQKMDCSVVICTRNRAGRLAETLSSVARLIIPAGTTWEVVVVDNGSTDATADVIRSFEPSLPIRRVWEPKPGISNARNAGAAAAIGKYLVCTDDDVHVEPQWLAAFLDAFQSHPEAAIFGGKIIPEFLPPTPRWFLKARDHLHIVFGARDFGHDPVPLSLDGKIPYGACYAIRGTEAKQFRYDPRLGRAPGRQRGGEETAFVEAMLKANHAGWWVPKAAVKHIIPPAMQTLDYVLQFYEGTGEEWAHAHLSANQPRMPLLLWLKLPIAYLRFVLAKMSCSKTWVHYRARLAWYRGVLKFCRCARLQSVHSAAET